MSNIISGKLGTVFIGASPVELPNVASWSLEPKVATNSHASNSTAGWKTRSAGVKDHTGKIKVYQTDSATPPALVIGTVYTVRLEIDASGSNYYGGSIMIESFGGMTVDMHDGKEITYEYSFGSNGTLTAIGNVPALT